MSSNSKSTTYGAASYTQSNDRRQQCKMGKLTSTGRQGRAAPGITVMMRPMRSKRALSPQVGPEGGRENRSLHSHPPTLPKGGPRGRAVSTAGERWGPWYPRPPASRSPACPTLTWASRALHTSCSLSGVMSTGTSNGEPSSCPPSSWNCTSSRCTSRVAASSCADKRGGRHSRGSATRGPPLPTPSGLGKAGARPRPPGRAG